MGLRIYGRGALSVLGARINSNMREVDCAVGGTPYDRIDYSSSHYQAVPVLETAIGIGYRRGSWDLDFGYEMAFWANAEERLVFTDDVDSQILSASNNDILLDGFFLRVTCNR